MQPSISTATTRGSRRSVYVTFGSIIKKKQILRKLRTHTQTKIKGGTPINNTNVTHEHTAARRSPFIFYVAPKLAAHPAVRLKKSLRNVFNRKLSKKHAKIQLVKQLYKYLKKKQLAHPNTLRFNAKALLNLRPSLVTKKKKKSTVTNRKPLIVKQFIRSLRRSPFLQAPHRFAGTARNLIHFFTPHRNKNTR